MKRCIFQSITITILIILNLTFGNSLPVRVSARQTSKTLNLSLPFKQCWSYQTKNIKSNIASDNYRNSLFFTTNESIFAFDFNTGKKLWETDLGGEIISNLADTKSKNNIYVIIKPVSAKKSGNTGMFPDFNNSNDTKTLLLRSISKDTGITNWQTSISLKSPEAAKATVFVQGNKIFVIGQSGSITAVNESEGDVLWEKSLNLEVIDNYFGAKDDNLLLVDKNRVILAELQTGKYVFQAETNSYLTTADFYKQTNLIVGSKKGDLFSIDIGTKKTVWKSRFGGQTSNIIFTPEGILATSFDNFVYLIEPESGKVKWKRRLDARLLIKPFILNEFLIAMTLGSPKAIVLDLDNGKLVNQIYVGSDNFFINSPVYSNYLIAFPTADGIYTFTSSNNDCPTE